VPAWLSLFVCRSIFPSAFCSCLPSFNGKRQRTKEENEEESDARWHALHERRRRDGRKSSVAERRVHRQNGDEASLKSEVGVDESFCSLTRVRAERCSVLGETGKRQ